MSSEQTVRKQADYQTKYDQHETLGSGSFSTVYRVVDKQDQKSYALKAIDKKVVQNKMELVETEIKIMSMIKHENVVQLFEIFESSTHINLVLEYITGGELFDKIIELKHYDEKHASLVVRQMLEGVAHLHSLGIVHRDLKPENLLLASRENDNQIKIADFGLSTLLPANNEKLVKAVGTPGYIAPEVLLTLDEVIDGYRHHVDVWAIGVIMYILLSGTAPFYGKDDDETFDLIIEGNYSYPPRIWANISEPAKKLLDQFLILDPEKRITPEEALKHPWMKEAVNTPLDTTQSNIKEFQHAAKLRASVQLHIAVDKWMKMGKQRRSTKLRESTSDYLKE